MLIGDYTKQNHCVDLDRCCEFDAPPNLLPLLLNSMHSTAFFRIQPLAMFLAMAGLAIASGCGNSNDLLAQVDNSTANQPAASSRREVLDLTRQETRRAVDLIEEIFSELNAVDSERSATVAISRIEQLVADFKSDTQKRNIVVEMTNAEYKELQSEMKAVELEVGGSIDDYKQRGEAAGRKIGANPSISMGTKMRLQRAMSGLATLSTAGPFRLGRRYPPDQIATVVVEGPKEAGELSSYLDDKYNLEMSSTSFSNGVHYMKFAAVPDIDDFASRIDIGTVARTNTRTRAMLVELSDTELQILRQRKEEREARLAREEQERKDKEEAERLAREQEKEQRVTGDVQSVVGRRDQLMADAVRTLQRIDSIQAARDSMRTLVSIRQELQGMDRQIDSAKERYRREMKRDYEAEGDIADVLAEVQSQLDRLNQDPMMRVTVARHLGHNVGARGVLFDESPSRGYSDPAEDASHPDYAVANLLDLKFGDSFEKRDALKRLGNADPAKLKDPALHGEIARAIRDVATTGDSFQKTEALEPLVVWGGKYSVPIVLEMLEESEGRGRNADAIFGALAKYPTGESAKEVARYVGNFFAHREACECLVAMGSVAEPAVMEIAPSNDAKVSVAAVVILGEIGTEQSLSLLRKAQKSRNNDVKQAAVDAIKKIVDRTEA